MDTINELVSLAIQHTNTIMPLYTHLQQAQVGVFSHYLISYADSLFRDFDRFFELYQRINQSPLGAGPVGGTSLPIDRNSTAKMLGFNGIVENSIDATSSRDFVAEYIASVAILMTNLSRISEDLIIWSSSEFSFLELSDAFTSPSSVMPQKKNPDILELTRGKTSQVIGYVTAILSTTKGLSSGYSRDLQQIKSSIWSSSKISITALIVIKSMLKTITINEENMRKATEDGYLVALDLAEKLVKLGIPFRSSHKIIGQIVHLAANSKKNLDQLTLDELSYVKMKEIKLGKLMELIKETSTISSLKDRKSRGSSGLSEQKRMIIQRNKKISIYNNKIKKQNMLIKKSLDSLSKRIRVLTK
jgi:argininosuccinate lyase